MQLDDVANECKKEKWVPLFVYRENGKTIIPLFKDTKVLKSFLRKNFPSEWLKAAFQLNINDLEKIKNENWQIRQMTYGNKLKDIPNIEFGIEILKIDEEPGLEFA